MSGDKHGAVAVVTGAATGIGQAFAIRLAHEGALVALLDQVEARETAARIVEAGGRALVVGCDVTDESSVASAATTISAQLGAPTILVNVAGIYPRTPLEQLTFAQWRHVLAVNLDGAFLVCRAFASGMRAARTGRIVNVSSAMVGGMTPGFVPYIASKMGVIGLTRALANDLGDANITVNAIAPGLTRTQSAVDMWASTPLFDTIADTQVIKRVEEVSDLVGAMSFLTSDEASFITGQTLMVDGGQIRV